VPVAVAVEEDGGVANVAIGDGAVEYLSARIELTEP
jgi:hypothetical protein